MTLPADGRYVRQGPRRRLRRLDRPPLPPDRRPTARTSTRSCPAVAAAGRADDLHADRPEPRRRARAGPARSTAGRWNARPSRSPPPAVGRPRSRLPDARASSPRRPRRGGASSTRSTTPVGDVRTRCSSPRRPTRSSSSASRTTTPAQPQAVDLPCDISGSFGAPGRPGPLPLPGEEGRGLLDRGRRRADRLAGRPGLRRSRRSTRRATAAGPRDRRRHARRAATRPGSTPGTRRRRAALAGPRRRPLPGRGQRPVRARSAATPGSLPAEHPPRAARLPPVPRCPTARTSPTRVTRPRGGRALGLRCWPRGSTASPGRSGSRRSTCRRACRCDPVVIPPGQRRRRSSSRPPRTPAGRRAPSGWSAGRGSATARRTRATSPARRRSAPTSRTRRSAAG